MTALPRFSFMYLRSHVHVMAALKNTREFWYVKPFIGIDRSKSLLLSLAVIS